MKNSALLGLCVISTCVSACGYRSVYDVAKPTDITIDKAMQDVGAGLGNMKSALDAKGLNTGLLVDEVTMTLNVSAAADRTGKLVLDASSPVLIGPSPGSAKIGVEETSSDKALRSNQIQVKFKNWYTAALNAEAKGVKQSPPVLFDEPAVQTCIQRGLCRTPYN
jgi:hypothetical protein